MASNNRRNKTKRNRRRNRRVVVAAVTAIMVIIDDEDGDETIGKACLHVSCWDAKKSSWLFPIGPYIPYIPLVAIFWSVLPLTIDGTLTSNPNSHG